MPFRRQGGASRVDDEQAKIDDTLDHIEFRLIVAGLVPYLGTPTSAVLTAITLWRGHYFEAVLSAVGMIPVVGSAANALRATKLGATAATRLAKATNSLSRAVKVAQVTAQGRKFVLFERTLTGGLGSKLVLGAYDLIFCKALRLACFTAGTPIEGRDGPKPIETFQDFETYGDACDWVMSRSEFDPNGPLTLRRVLRKFERHASVIELRLPGGETIGTTAEHPFYRRGEGWVKAGELQPGDEVRLKDTGWVQIEAVEDTGRYEIVYNMEVEDDHTYFVGCAEWGFSVWAHNACNLNTNGAISRFGIYQIYVNGTLYKIGKADLNRITQSSGLPTRLHQQIRKLEQAFGKGSVIHTLTDLGTTTTQWTKAAETAVLRSTFERLRIVPPGNIKSFFP